MYRYIALPVCRRDFRLAADRLNGAVLDHGLEHHGCDSLDHGFVERFYFPCLDGLASVVFGTAAFVLEKVLVLQALVVGGEVLPVELHHCVGAELA